MTVSKDLIDRLSTEVGQRMTEKARAGRRHALDQIVRCCVTVATEGGETREEYFEDTPTLDEIRSRVGCEVQVLAMTRRLRALTKRLRLVLYAA